MKQIQLFIPILQTWKQRWVKEFLRSHVWKEAESRLDSGSLAPAQSVSFLTLAAVHFERALWVFCVLLCSSVCLALSIWAWAYRVLFQLEGVGQMAALSFWEDGPERTTALCNGRGRYSQCSQWEALAIPFVCLCLGRGVEIDIKMLRCGYAYSFGIMSLKAGSLHLCIPNIIWAWRRAVWYRLGIKF